MTHPRPFATDSAVLNPVISLVMPCLNEGRTVGDCVRQGFQVLETPGLPAEVIVCDNGSADGSAECAAQAGAIVVDCSQRGYGLALRTAIAAARGQYIVMADTDGSHDLTAVPQLIRCLQQGADLVVGNRFQGGIEPGAMPWLNRVIGNPGLSWLINRICGTRIGDTQCGFRAFTRDAADRLKLDSDGMEFASEMLVKAARLKLRIDEIPVRMFRDGRGRAPHLLPLQDGWRHLKFLLMFSPLHLFLLPGAILGIVGMILTLLPLPGVFRFGPYYLDIHWMVLGILLLLVGVQIMQFGIIARLYTVQHCFPEVDPALVWLQKWLTLERGLVAGGLMIGVGTVIDLWILVDWITPGPALMQVRPALLATALMAIGTQTLFFSFLFAIMQRRSAARGERSS